LVFTARGCIMTLEKQERGGKPKNGLIVIFRWEGSFLLSLIY
jgi:hypothetical protein